MRPSTSRVYRFATTAWCQERDSNPHSLAATAVWTQRGYRYAILTWFPGRDLEPSWSGSKPDVAPVRQGVVGTAGFEPALSEV